MRVPSRYRAVAAGRRARGRRHGGQVGLQPRILPSGAIARRRETGIMPLALMTWARKYVDGTRLVPRSRRHPMCWRPATSSMWRPTARRAGCIWSRCPMSKGALVAMDPHTGRVLALVGGFSYGQSQFNRAVQALRQPGSSFKPFVYAAALDNGYTPSSVVLDAPIEFKLPNGEMWRPQELPEQVLRPLDLAPRHRAVAQRHDGPSRQRSRHEQDRRPGAAPRHL